MASCQSQQRSAASLPERVIKMGTVTIRSHILPNVYMYMSQPSRRFGWFMQNAKQRSPASLPRLRLQHGALRHTLQPTFLAVQMYMSQQEVVDALQERAKIEPAFTQLVGSRAGWCFGVVGTVLVWMAGASCVHPAQTCANKLQRLLMTRSVCLSSGCPLHMPIGTAELEMCLL